jgi:hypothetical protein
MGRSCGRKNRSRSLAADRSGYSPETKRAARGLPNLHPLIQYRRSALRLLLFRWLLRRRSRLLRRRCGRMRRTGHSFLEIANALAQPAHHFGNLPSAEQKQHDGQHHQPMKNTKLTHKPPPRTLPRARYPHPSAGRLARQACAPPHAYRITRSSPTRRVTRSRSKYSSRGIAYFRVIPVNSLNTGTDRHSPLVFL